MTKNYLILFLVVATGTWVLRPAPAKALTLSVFGGSYLASGEGGLAGGETSLQLAPVFDLGVFFEYSASSQPLGDHRYFYGAVGRYKLPLLNFFADARAGAHHTVDGYGFTLDGAYVQGGLGYSFSVIPELLRIQPRLGILLAETSGRFPFLEAGVMASFSF